MATPSFLRDLPPRVKSLGSPVVWAPLTIFALLSIFVWEFSKNPDWFNREQVSNLNPNSTLTPEEQARLSEIDTIDLLIEQSRVPGGTPEATSIINPDAPELEAVASEAQEETDSRQLSGRENPFDEYEAQYAFPGSANSQTSTLTPTTPSSAVSSGGGNSGGSGLATPRGRGESFNFGTGLVNPSAPATNSALSDALSRQQAAREATEQQDGAQQPTAASGNGIGARTPQPISGGTADLSGSQTTGLPAIGGQPDSQPVGSSSPQPAALSNNLSVPFTPGTLNTSPPVGTTGYQVPATANLPVFNTQPQQPTRNPFPTAPSATQPATQTPQSDTLYTAPTSIQPAQNQRRR